jgi:hypothetical protein
MSFALDVNVLVYASDEQSPFSARARRVLDECVRSPELFCLTWPTLNAYLRLTTNPAASRAALTTAQAAANVNALLNHPRTRLLTEEPGFWEVYRDLLEAHKARTKFVHDVHLAALLRQHGVRTLYTHDRDFRRFDFLDVRDPFAG